ncbi:hypothetical protein [Nocardioides allogilvus]|nr:hypothetical protein [Nocardioides allogilvus]
MSFLDDRCARPQADPLAAIDVRRAVSTAERRTSFPLRSRSA